MDNKNNARLGKGLSSIFGQDVSKVLDDIQNGDMEVERQIGRASCRERV